MSVYVYPMADLPRIAVHRRHGDTFITVPISADEDRALRDSAIIGDLITDAERAEILDAYGVPDSATLNQHLADDRTCRVCGTPDALRSPVLPWPACPNPRAHLRAV